MAIILKDRAKFKLLYFDDHFNECSESFETKAKAEKRKKQITKKYPLVFNTNKDTPMVDFMNLYVENIISKIDSHKTYILKKGLCTNYINQHLDSLKIKDINFEATSQFINKLENTPINKQSTTKITPYISGNTLYKCFTFLRTSFRYLYINELIDDNPFKEIIVPKLSKRNRNEAKWTLKLFEEVLDRCNDSDLYIFLHLLFNTGLDIKEILALEINDVYISNEFLNSNACFIESNKVVERIKKENITYIKNEIIKIHETKLVGRTNTKLVCYRKETSKKVMIPNSLAKVLLEYIDLIRYVHIQANSSSSLLFVNKNGEPIDDRTMFKKFEEIRPDKKLTFKNLSTFGATNAQYSIGSLYYYQLDGTLSLPTARLKNKETQINKLSNEKRMDDFVRKIANSIPTEEDVNVNEFMDFLKTHDDFRIQLLHKLKEVI